MYSIITNTNAMGPKNREITALVVRSVVKTKEEVIELYNKHKEEIRWVGLFICIDLETGLEAEIETSNYVNGRYRKLYEMVNWERYR